MIRLNAETEYAVMMLKQFESQNLLTLDSICKTLGMAKPYNYKILSMLVKAGLVEGNRGARGGYRLRKPLSEISYLDVYMATKPAGEDYRCNNKYCNKCHNEEVYKPECTLHKMLQSVQNALYTQLANASIS